MTSQGSLLIKDGLERMAMKKVRGIKEMRPKVSRSLKVSTHKTSISHTEAQKTGNRWIAQRPKQRTHRLRLCSSMSSAGLSKCSLTVSTTGWLRHPTRTNMKFQQ